MKEVHRVNLCSDLCFACAIRIMRISCRSNIYSRYHSLYTRNAIYAYTMLRLYAIRMQYHSQFIIHSFKTQINKSRDLNFTKINLNVIKESKKIEF